MKDESTLKSAALQEALSNIGRMNRRSFLGFSAAAIAATAVGGLSLSTQAMANTLPALKSINSDETAVFARIADVTLPVEGSSLAAWNYEVLLGTLDQALLGTMAPHVLAGLKGGIAYFNSGPKEKYGKTFVELTPAEATAIMDAWSDSAEIPPRALQVGLKKLIQLSYWANPESWGPTGYDGPVSKKNNYPVLGNADLPAA